MTSRLSSAVCMFCLLGAFLFAGTVAAEPARVLVCTVTQGFRHSSIPHGERAIQAIAEETGKFVVTDWVRQVPDLVKLDPAYLRANKIDGVIFLNTSGELDMPDVEGFVQWIEEGGAFAGMHAASDTLKKSRPYMNMLQGCFEWHGPQVPATLHAGCVDHAANGGIGETWNLTQEEMYIVRDHDREKVRSLWFMRHHPNRTDEAGYYPLSWARMAGEGRVFYTALGHREDLWDTSTDLRGRINSVEIAKQFRAHIAGGILWSLGLAEGSATPNPEVN